MDTWFWPQYLVAAWIGFNVICAIFREAKFSAKGQKGYLTVIGLFVSCGVYVSVTYALSVGGFW